MRISVITATLNPGDKIKVLANALGQQTSTDFEWIIADGGSKQPIGEQLPMVGLYPNIEIITRQDFGIYDAINYAVGIARGEYYVVIGADDVPAKTMVENYIRATDSDADIVSAHVISGRTLRTPMKGQPWRRGHSAYLAHHSLGALIRKSLHQRYGLYSNRYPIAADQLFIQQAVLGGARVSHSNFIAGTYNETGVSGTDLIGVWCELYRIQVSLGYNRWIQLLLLAFRLLRTSFARSTSSQSVF